MWACAASFYKGDGGRARNKETARPSYPNEGEHDRRNRHSGRPERLRRGGAGARLRSRRDRRRSRRGRPRPDDRGTDHHGLAAALPERGRPLPAADGGGGGRAREADRAGRHGAKERMITSNLRLVVSIARRYQTQGITLGDLIQEGVIGLIRATEKFDWRKGFKF